MLAMRTVLESPELLRSIFDHCDMATLVQISSVIRSSRSSFRPEYISEGGSACFGYLRGWQVDYLLL
jgi:hypothetical protein